MNKKFTLAIACDNDAFGENEYDCLDEIVGILRQAIRALDARRTTSALRDSNGNVVGSYAVEGSK